MVRLRKKTQLEEISSASMSDVAFLLLVFFMVASVFYVKEGLSSSLPKKDSQPQQVQREQVYKFLVGPGTVVVENPAIGKKTFATDTGFGDRLAGLPVEDLGKKYALIRTERGVRVEQVVSVLAAVKRRGFKNISMQRGLR